MKRLATRFLCGLLLICIALNIGWSQGSTAQIGGTITDSSGAILPGFEVTITQTETGVMRISLTNEARVYVLANLPVGPYKIEAALLGFRTFVQTGIVLQVNSNPIINVVLQVGQVTE